MNNAAYSCEVWFVWASVKAHLKSVTEQTVQLLHFMTQACRECNHIKCRELKKSNDIVG